mmetsp:Transcript_50902/g.122718  ORF Transcript_50902/g.122718 Transcript_50902/m.122718 type:complete len:314 (+) Transcript_50902:172-1113(+)
MIGRLRFMLTLIPLLAWKYPSSGAVNDASHPPSVHWTFTASSGFHVVVSRPPSNNGREYDNEKSPLAVTLGVTLFPPAKECATVSFRLSASTLKLISPMEYPTVKSGVLDETSYFGLRLIDPPNASIDFVTWIRSTATLGEFRSAAPTTWIPVSNAVAWMFKSTTSRALGSMSPRTLMTPTPGTNARNFPQTLDCVTTDSTPPFGEKSVTAMSRPPWTSTPSVMVTTSDSHLALGMTPPIVPEFVSWPTLRPTVMSGVGIPRPAETTAAVEQNTARETILVMMMVVLVTTNGIRVGRVWEYCIVGGCFLKVMQ